MSATSAPESADPLGPLAQIPAVRNAVTESRTAIDRLRAHRSQRRHGAAIATESALRGAAAAAALELAPELALPLEDVRAITRAAPPTAPPAAAGTGQPDGSDPARAAAIGALRAYAELPLLSATWARSPLQVLARLHLLVASGSVEDTALGRPSGAAEREEPASSRLLDLAEVLGRTRAPALIVAAIVHAEIASLRPFSWGSTIVALAAQRVVLAGRGLDPALQGVPEVGHLEAGTAYGEALSAYATGGSAGVVAWVQHCADAVIIGAQQGLAIGEAAVRG